MTQVDTLTGTNLTFEIDPNEHGLPFLIIHHRYQSGLIDAIMLNRKGTEALIQALQEQLKDLVTGPKEADGEEG